MKIINRVLLVLAFALTGSYAVAETTEADHTAHHPDDAAKPAEATAQKSSNADMPMMADMQDNMKMMQETMQKIHVATTDADRKKLMEEHMKLMSDHMKMMKGMNGEGAMADMNGKHGMGMMEGGMKCGMMDKMDMMQKMMDQMMQHMAEMK